LGKRKGSPGFLSIGKNQEDGSEGNGFHIGTKIVEVTGGFGATHQ